MFVGVPPRVRDMFDQAKQAPCMSLSTRSTRWAGIGAQVSVADTMSASRR